MLDVMIAYLWPEAMPSLTFVGDERDPSEGDVGPDLVFATQDRYITVEAGCTWEKLNEALEGTGLRTGYWGPLSGINATVGGRSVSRLARQPIYRSAHSSNKASRVAVMMASLVKVLSA